MGKILTIILLFFCCLNRELIRSALLTSVVDKHKTLIHHAKKDSEPKIDNPYDIITPIKVTAKGDFLSHDLNHTAHGIKLGGKWAGRRKTRKKRSVDATQIDKIHVNKLHYLLPIEGGEPFMVELEPNSRYLAPHAVVERRSKFRPGENRSSIKIGSILSHVSTIDASKRCHFTGRILNHPSSSVAISACDGLKGFLKTNSTEYLIEPLNDQLRRNGQPHPHKIYKRSILKEHSAAAGIYEGQCGSKDHANAILRREIWESNKKKGRNREPNLGKEKGKRRSRRSVSLERNVEVLVVADNEMIKFYTNEDLNTYILTIMNMVSTIYHDASLGNAVNIIVVRIMLLETPEYEDHSKKELNITNNADDTLVSFCKWQQTINPTTEEHPHHHDLAVLLTRHNICSRSNAQCSTLGLSEIAGMCQPHRSCNVNEDIGLQIAYTIAHEIGHNFGMNHDSLTNGCGSMYGVNHYVMSPHLSPDIMPLTWSNCSRNEITEFLDREWGTCLVDKPEQVEEYTFPELPPGAMYDADHQCRLIFGPKAEHCNGIEMECQTLWCRIDKSCITRLEPAAEGTKCAKHKWCYYGECVTMGDRPTAIHGNWGSWSSWSGCSRSCGAGVAMASRQCDNPSPANGGKYCTGDRRRYRICNIEDCPENAMSFRAVQCSDFNNKTLKGKNHTWAPVTVEGSPCQLHCKPDNEFYSVVLKEFVIDGTPCKPGYWDMCIHGVCKRIACDWSIEGKAQEDRCGLCHGDGTQCVTTRGHYNVSHNIGYVEVMTFPARARNVRVMELGNAANFFAVKDKTTGYYFLNGNWIIQWSGEYSIRGVMMYYNRENETERLFFPGPLKQPLTLMILFQTKNPGIKWEYTLPNENATYTPEFHWHYRDWSVCTRTCGTGTQILVAQCLENEAGLVEEKYCEKEVKLVSKKRACNTHACPAWWWTGPWQPCTVTCGTLGNRKRTVICVRNLGPTEQMALLDTDCFSTSKPHDKESCSDVSPCHSELEWSVGPWNKTCKDDPCELEGREVICNSGKSTCDPLTKPAGLRQCGNASCGQWDAGLWGECSTTCGEGVQIRNVICNGGSTCSQQDEPSSVKECIISDCGAANEGSVNERIVGISIQAPSEPFMNNESIAIIPTFLLNATKLSVYDSHGISSDDMFSHEGNYNKRVVNSSADSQGSLYVNTDFNTTNINSSLSNNSSDQFTMNELNNNTNIDINDERSDIEEKINDNTVHSNHTNESGYEREDEIDTDIVHLNFSLKQDIGQPFTMTHDNLESQEELVTYYDDKKSSANTSEENYTREEFYSNSSNKDIIDINWGNSHNILFGNKEEYVITPDEYYDYGSIENPIDINKYTHKSEENFINGTNIIITPNPANFTSDMEFGLMNDTNGDIERYIIKENAIEENSSDSLDYVNDNIKQNITKTNITVIKEIKKDTQVVEKIERKEQTLKEARNKIGIDGFEVKEKIILSDKGPEIGETNIDISKRMNSKIIESDIFDEIIQNKTNKNTVNVIYIPNDKEVGNYTLNDTERIIKGEEDKTRPIKLDISQTRSVAPDISEMDNERKLNINEIDSPFNVSSHEQDITNSVILSKFKFQNKLKIEQESEMQENKFGDDEITVDADVTISDYDYKEEEQEEEKEQQQQQHHVQGGLQHKREEKEQQQLTQAQQEEKEYGGEEVEEEENNMLFDNHVKEMDKEGKLNINEIDSPFNVTSHGQDITNSVNLSKNNFQNKEKIEQENELQENRVEDDEITVDADANKSDYDYIIESLIKRKKYEKSKVHEKLERQEKAKGEKEGGGEEEQEEQDEEGEEEEEPLQQHHVQGGVQHKDEEEEQEQPTQAQHEEKEYGGEEVEEEENVVLVDNYIYYEDHVYDKLKEIKTLNYGNQEKGENENLLGQDGELRKRQDEDKNEENGSAENQIQNWSHEQDIEEEIKSYAVGKPLQKHSKKDDIDNDINSKETVLTFSREDNTEEETAQSTEHLIYDDEEKIGNEGQYLKDEIENSYLIGIDKLKPNTDNYNTEVSLKPNTSIESNNTMVMSTVTDNEILILEASNETKFYNYEQEDQYESRESISSLPNYENDFKISKETTNSAEIDRPEGIAEDDMEIEDVQVIVLNFESYEKNENDTNATHKPKINKVQLKTGSKAFEILKSFEEKAKEEPTLLETNLISPERNTNTLTYGWAISKWSKCSESCGGGVQRRAVECHNILNGTVLQPWECQTMPPSDLQRCNMFKCLNWTMTIFGPCSTTCGSGVRLRNVSCPEEGRCSKIDKPTTSEDCMDSPCAQWVEGPWSMCTKSCGEGYQIRFVKCVDLRIQEASQECEDNQPPHKRPCNVKKCLESNAQQDHCEDSLDSQLCTRLVHMCATKFFRVKCCKTCQNTLKANSVIQN